MDHSAFASTACTKALVIKTSLFQQFAENTHFIGRPNGDCRYLLTAAQ